MEVPSLEYGGMTRAVSTRKEAAGKGINVSRMLRLLGEPTTALALLGQSSVGNFQRLARETGLSIVYVLIPGETRTNIHIQELHTGRNIKVNQPGPEVDSSHFEHFTMLFRRHLRGAGMVCLAGSLPPGLGMDAYGRLVELAVKSDVPVIVDAEGPALLEAIRKGPFMAKPNRKELAATLGRRLTTLDDVIDGARKLQELGAQSVVVTDSGERIVGLEGGTVYIAHPPRVEIRGTLGAGDSLTAGMARVLARGGSFEEALKFGTAAGSAACLTEDTRAAKSEDIDSLLGEVIIERL